MPTTLTPKTQETSGQDAAIQKRPELLFDEMRDKPVSLLLSLEKRLELLRNDFVQ